MHSVPFDVPTLEPMLPPPPLGRAVVIGANVGAGQRFPRLESSSSSSFVPTHHHHHHHTMPPQPGVFALPYSANSHIHHNNHKQLMPHRHHDPHNGMPPPAMIPEDMNSKHRKKKPPRPGRYYSETSAALHGTAHQIATDPSSNPHFALRLYPISLERSARLTQISFDEDSANAAIALAYEEEKERIEKEWKIGREKVREKLLEGVEERRRRAKEERDSETIIGDGNGDSQTRPHITRKLRNQLGSSPPPSHGHAAAATVGITTANSNSLQVEEIPSPFPLALTSLPTPGLTGTGATGRKKGKGGAAQAQSAQTLGKAVLQLTSMRDGEVESDLGEIRRGAKRKRAQMK